MVRAWVGPSRRESSVNPSGGVIGRGHPVGASGVAEVAEVALQLRGEAGRHATARRPRVGLAHAMSGIGSHNYVTVLGSAGR